MDYIPKQDAAAAAWIANFAAILAVSYAAYGCTSGEGSGAATKSNTLAAALEAATNPSTRNAGTVAAKNDAMADAVLYIRPLAQRIAVSNTIDTQAKIDIGVNPRISQPTPIPPPETAPALAIKTAIPGQVTFEHNNPTTGRRDKPPGVVAIQVAAVVGTSHTSDPSAAVTRGDYTKGLIRVGFQPNESGLKVSVFARYKTRSGPQGIAQVGPWSTPVQFVAM